MKNLLSLAFMLMYVALHRRNLIKLQYLKVVLRSLILIHFEAKDSKGLIFGTCLVTVRFYNADGELTGTRIHTFYNVESESDCKSWATAVRLSYILQE
jgi:hypothetical protein